MSSALQNVESTVSVQPENDELWNVDVELECVKLKIINAKNVHFLIFADLVKFIRKFSDLC